MPRDDATKPIDQSITQRQRGTRRLRDILSLEDLEAAARRRLPNLIFQYYKGGTERDMAVTGMRRAFDAWYLKPRVLTPAAATRSPATTLFGRPYAAPFGICPMGGAGFAWHRADSAMAMAAAKADIPFILSGAAMEPLERIREVGPTAWFQAYFPGDRAIIGPLVDRVEYAGYDVLVLTVDVAVPGNRENNVRHGYSTPLRPTVKLGWDGVTHPDWLLNTAWRTLQRDGVPHLENAAATRGVPMFSSRAVRGSRGAGLTWDEVRWVREIWPRKLVLKGVLAAEDVKLAREIGFDGVIVSSHGGRQLDYAVPPLRMLPEALAEAGGMAVMLDGGIRRATDAIKALALGAHFVFLGRPFMYAVAIAGEEGVSHAIRIMLQELNTDMALLGAETIAQLNPALLVPAG